jgi:hypothetical protein
MMKGIKPARLVTLWRATDESIDKVPRDDHTSREKVHANLCGEGRTRPWGLLC